MGVFSKEVITPFTTASASFSPTTSTFLPFVNSSSRALVNWFSMSGRRVLLENCGMAIFFTSGGRELTVPARWYPQPERARIDNVNMWLVNLILPPRLPVSSAQQPPSLSLSLLYVPLPSHQPEQLLLQYQLLWLMRR